MGIEEALVGPGCSNVAVENGWIMSDAFAKTVLTLECGWLCEMNWWQRWGHNSACGNGEGMFVAAPPPEAQHRWLVIWNSHTRCHFKQSTHFILELIHLVLDIDWVKMITWAITLNNTQKGSLTWPNFKTIWNMLPEMPLTGSMEFPVVATNSMPTWLLQMKFG